jgi:hypothetical protein
MPPITVPAYTPITNSDGVEEFHKTVNVVRDPELLARRREQLLREINELGLELRNLDKMAAEDR